MQIHRYANWALAVTALALVAYTFLDHGMSWDEPIQSLYGDLVLGFYDSGFEDRKVLSLRDLYRYGGWFDAPVQWLSHRSPLGEFGTRRLATALVGLVGVLFCGLTARRIAGAWAGFWAALLLLSTPVYFGHMFMNPKDLPLAAGCMASLYFIVRVGLCPLEARWREILALGAVMGMTIGIRIGGVVLCMYLAVAVMLSRPPDTSWRAYVNLVAPRLAAAYGTAYAVMLVFWPYALLNPISGPLTALRATSAYPLKIKVLLGGDLVVSRDLPLAYIPEYFAVKLPLVLLVAFVLGLVFAVRPATLGARDADARPMWILALAALFPLSYALVMGTNHYDGIRHFLFVVPPVACMAGVGVASLLRDARRKTSHRAVLGTVLAAGVGASAIGMYRLHPYEYTYYNELAGGLAGAEGRYEMDYWGLSFREAAREIDEWVRAEGVKGSPEAPIKLYINGPRDSALYFLDDTYAWVGSIDEADFAICLVKEHRNRDVPGERIVEVTRDGAVLSFVNDLRAVN